MKLAQKILVVLMILAVIPAQAGNAKYSAAPASYNMQYKYNTFGAREIADCKVAAKQITLVALGNCEADDKDDKDQEESADCKAARAIKSNDYSEKGCKAIMYLHQSNFEE